MQLSDFGKKFGGPTGVDQVQEDLMKALAIRQPLAMFGSGNPAHIPEVSAVFKNKLTEIIADPKVSEAMLGNYDGPQGNTAFISSVRDFMNRHYNLGITNDNITITSGSQPGYFMLFNMLAGRSGHTKKKILFPMVPEYFGYIDQALERDEFISTRPQIRKIDDHKFEYIVDFEHLPIDDEVAAMCLSRPTNPTGNVVSKEELEQLAKLAIEHDIPLIIDNAYGLPFPNIVTSDMELFWNDHVIHSMTLSKIGLPSSRVGIFIGPAPLMQALARVNAVVSLTSPSMGQYITKPLLDSDEVIELSQRYIGPYYLEHSRRMHKLIDKHFPSELPWRLHDYQGSYFFWLWLEGAKKTSREVYEYLKQRGVLVVPGDYFFLEHTDLDWPHTQECLRIYFARPDQELEAGIPILAEAVNWAYAA